MTHVYKTTLAGNGGLYGWKEIDENGELVRESAQTYSSEADAEKAIRTIAPTTDIVEVMNVKNINAEANTNVNLIKKNVREYNYGMNAVAKGVEEILKEANAPKVEEKDTAAAKEAEEKAKAKAQATETAEVLSVALNKALEDQKVIDARTVSLANPAPVVEPVVVEHENKDKMADMPIFKKAEELAREKAKEAAERTGSANRPSAKPETGATGAPNRGSTSSRSVR